MSQAPTAPGRTSRRSWSLAACTLLLGITLGASGSETEPLERILETARTFLVGSVRTDSGSETRIEIGRLDSRLRLRRCAHLPTAELAPGARLEGNSTVKVRCAEPVPWSIFVPVSIERYSEVVVAARPLTRARILTPADLRVEQMETSSLTSGYFQGIRPLLGMQLKRPLTPGQVLIGAHLTQPRLVERGQQVTLYSARPGLRVRMKGVALESGTEGERIRVRNRSSKRVVEGIVDPSGAVRVAL